MNKIMKLRSFFNIMSVVAVMSACDDGVPENLEFEQFKNLYLSSASDQLRRIMLPEDMKRDTSFVFGNVIYGGTTNFGQGNIEVEIGADFSLVEAYNAENNTSFEPLPEENFALDFAKLVIENGTKYSRTAKLFVSPDKLEQGKEYLLPLTILSATGNIPVNEERKTTYWSVTFGDAILVAKDICPLGFDATATRMSITESGAVYTLTADAAANGFGEGVRYDPYVYTTSLGRPLMAGGSKYLLTFEYTSNRTITDAQFFFAINSNIPPMAQAEYVTEMNINIPQGSDWRRFELDITDAVVNWGFGVHDNNSLGGDPATHRIRFDLTETRPLYVLTIRYMQIETY